MHGEQRRGRAKFDGEIPVTHDVHGVLGEARFAGGVHVHFNLVDPERGVDLGIFGGSDCPLSSISLPVYAIIAPLSPR
jgi:hypothetical protein